MKKGIDISKYLNPTNAKPESNISGLHIVYRDSKGKFVKSSSKKVHSIQRYVIENNKKVKFGKAITVSSKEAEKVHYYQEVEVPKLQRTLAQRKGEENWGKPRVLYLDKEGYNIITSLPDVILTRQLKKTPSLVWFHYEIDGLYRRILVNSESPKFGSYRINYNRKDDSVDTKLRRSWKKDLGIWYLNFVSLVLSYDKHKFIPIGFEVLWSEIK